MTDEATGKDVLDYQGNWRDIFQNWEALAWSFPYYNDAFIHKFLNAAQSMVGLLLWDRVTTYLGPF